MKNVLQPIRFVAVLGVIICLNFSAGAQTQFCLMDASSGCDVQPPCPLESPVEDLPRVTMHVAIHFVKGICGFEFVNKGPNNYDPDNGYTQALALIDQANARIQNLIPNPVSLSPDHDFLGNSNLRYELFPNTANAIFYHSTVAAMLQTPEYKNPQVFHIVVRDNNNCNGVIGGFTNFFSNSLTILGWQEAIGNGTGGGALSGVFLHEVGHVFGLCHSFACCNSCKYAANSPGTDINIPAECGDEQNIPDPMIPYSNSYEECYNSCGLNPPPGICHYGNGSTNIMCYTPGHYSLSPCQWNIWMGNVLTSTNPYLLKECLTASTQQPYPVETDETWSGIRAMKRDVHVKNGATLTITCLVLMETGRRIVVERGARLIVTGSNARITNTCTGEKWRGIVVEGNNDIGHSADLANPNTLLQPGNSMPGSVFILNKATVENAIDAISTNPDYLSWPQISKNWNGLVVTNDAKFFNNTRSVELMNANGVNSQGQIVHRTVLSSFTNTRFENKDGSALRGISNWSADGVRITEGCVFKNLKNIGYESWDAGAVVTGSTFEGCYYGIHDGASSTLWSDLTVGGDKKPNEKNKFNNNQYGIFSLAVNQSFIINNSFKNNAICAISNQGYSAYDIYDNEIEGGFDGIANDQTQDGSKDLHCNEYLNTYFGTTFLADNKSTRIYGEKFTGTSSGADVLLLSFNPTFPAVLQHQGSNGAANWNYFSSATEPRLITLGSTNTFDYYYPQQGGNTEPRCASNVTNGNCSISYNFNSFPTGKDAPDCTIIPDSECKSRPCFEQTNSELNTLLSIAGNNPTPSQTGAIAELKFKKRRIMDGLSSQYLSENNFTGLEEIWQNEPGISADRARLGIAIQKGDWQLAASRLNALPNLTTDELAFREIEQVNLARLQYAGIFQLTNAQKTMLQTHAAGLYPSAAHARALLGLLERQYFEANLPQPIAPRSEKQEQTRPSPQADLVVRPNPANDFAEVFIPKGKQGLSKKLIVSRMDGRVLFQKTVSSSDLSVWLDLNNTPTGIYLVTIFDANDDPLSFGRLVKQQ